MRSRAFHVCLLVIVVASGLGAADRFAALSLIESSDNDHAIGPRGEISRYQMQLGLWHRYAPTNADWTNPSNSLMVAKAIMDERCDAFERSSNRPPNDFEFYVLWNAPSQLPRPSRRVADRATRFCNVLQAMRADATNALNNNPRIQPN